MFQRIASSGLTSKAGVNSFDAWAPEMQSIDTLGVPSFQFSLRITRVEEGLGF
jgi:hypothetical protein